MGQRANTLLSTTWANALPSSHQLSHPWDGIPFVSAKFASLLREFALLFGQWAVRISGGMRGNSEPKMCHK